MIQAGDLPKDADALPISNSGNVCTFGSLDATPDCQDCLPASPFRLLIDRPAAGAWNMAVDEALLESAAIDGRSTLRLYQWETPTLSLGYFQPYADRRRHSASDACPAVRRASGGGAILHDHELTYSLAVPAEHPLAADRLRLYHEIHSAQVAVFAQWGVEAALAVQLGRSPPGLASPHADHRTASETPVDRNQPFLCFQRRSPGDVLAGCVKLAGSAQRRCRRAVIQHGSILLARSTAAPELQGMKEMVGAAISPNELVEAFVAELAPLSPGGWRNGTLSDSERRRASILVAEKYASPIWTMTR
jgi:lipoate-protein ligase A